MNGGRLLTLNAGSSSIKFALFQMESAGPRRQAGGSIDLRRAPLVLRLIHAGERSEHSLNLPPEADLAKIMAASLACLEDQVGLADLRAVGHRVVHGGDAFAGPVRLDPSVIEALESLIPFAPLHQPQNLALIRAIGSLRPDLVQMASFDTAFHRSNAPLIRRFALPRELFDQGIKRYGFHGLSYKYIASVLAREMPQATKAVIAHLGSGASLCALGNGTSRDTSMGFSTLDGVPMATRCGALDPGVLLHLMEHGGQSPASLREMLYHRSGLLGLSGISSDSRDLLQSQAPEAREAIEIFTLRCAGEVARLAATMGGLDTLVFTAGIGENQPEIRRAICDRLLWLGIRLDQAANTANARYITATDSRIAVMVIPTDEEQVIAEEACSIFLRDDKSC